MSLKQLLTLISTLALYACQAQIQPRFITDTLFAHPESAVYDAVANCVYISNMDKTTPVDSLYTDFISSISTTGEILELKWLEGLSSPTGLALFEGLLYAVERNGIAIIDPKTKGILQRIPIDAKGFLNDIAIANDGSIFVSETEQFGRIFRIEKGQSRVWIQDSAVAFTNGLLVVGDYLYAGVNGDHYLKRIHLESQKIEPIVELGPGNIDGIQQDGESLLVSHFMGNLYRISPDGSVETLLNTREKEIFIADFAFIPTQNLLIIPSLRTHRIHGYQLKK